MSQSNDQTPDAQSGEPKPAPNAPSSASTLTKLVVGGVIGGFAAAKALGLLSIAAKAAAPAAVGYLARKLSEAPEKGTDPPQPSTPPPSPVAKESDEKAPEPAAALPQVAAPETAPAPEIEAKEEESDEHFFDPFASGKPNPAISPLAKNAPAPPRLEEKVVPKADAFMKDEAEEEQITEEAPKPSFSDILEELEASKPSEIEPFEPAAEEEPEQTPVAGQEEAEAAEAAAAEAAVAKIPTPPAPASAFPPLTPMFGVLATGATAAAAFSGKSEDLPELTSESEPDSPAVEAVTAHEFPSISDTELDSDDTEVSPFDLPAPLVSDASAIAPDQSPFPSLTEIEDEIPELPVSPVEATVAPAPAPIEEEKIEEEKDVFGFLDHSDDPEENPSLPFPGAKPWSTSGFTPSPQVSPFLIEDDFNFKGEKTNGPAPQDGPISPLWTTQPTAEEPPQAAPEAPGAMPSQFFELPPAVEAPTSFVPPASTPFTQIPAAREEGSKPFPKNPWDELPVAPIVSPATQSKPSLPAAAHDEPLEADLNEDPPQPFIPSGFSPSFPSAVSSPFDTDDDGPIQPLHTEAFDLPASPKSPFPAANSPFADAPHQPKAADFDPIQVFLEGQDDDDKASGTQGEPFLPAAKVDVEEAQNRAGTKPAFPTPWDSPESTIDDDDEENEVATPFIPNPRSNPFAKADKKETTPESERTPQGSSPFLNLDKSAPSSHNPFPGTETAKKSEPLPIPFPDERTPITKKRSLLLPITLIGLAAAGAGAGGYFLINANRDKQDNGDTAVTGAPAVTLPVVKKDAAPEITPTEPTEPEITTAPSVPLDPDGELINPPIEPAPPELIDPLLPLAPVDPEIFDKIDTPFDSAPETILPATPVDVPDPAGNPAGIDSPPKATIPSIPGAPETSEELGAIRIDSEKTIKAFLNANTIEERMLFSHNVDGLKEAMSQYYTNGVSPGPIPTTSVEMKIKGNVPGTSFETFLYHIATPSQPQGFPVSIEETTLGFRVDWEAFVQFNDNLLKNFLDNPGGAPGQFYVILRRSHFFGEKNPDSSNLLSYRVISPIATDIETFAFVDKRKVIGEYFDSNFTWGRTYRPVLKLKWELDPNDKPRVIVEELIRSSWRGGK